MKAVRGNAVVPGYVLEYLLGQYAASDDEATIQEGIDTVRSILAEHYVHRNMHMAVKSFIRRRAASGSSTASPSASTRRMTSTRPPSRTCRSPKSSSTPATVKANEKLLVGGVWCICDIEYVHNDSPGSVPWQLGSLKAIQIAGVDFDTYYDGRRSFSTEEWIDCWCSRSG